MRNPFRRRSLQPRGDVLRRLDETGNPVNEPESPSTGGLSNWPVIGWLAASRRGPNIISHASRLPSDPPQIPRSPDDPSANRLGPHNVEVIAGMRRIPDVLPTPKPEADRCPHCHHPIGHTSDCRYWRFLGVIPDDD